MKTETKKKIDNEKWVNNVGKLPEELKTAIYLNKAVLFLGAGVSVQYKMPTWEDLSKKLLEECLSKGAITNDEKNIIDSKRFSPMELVTYSCIFLDELKSGLGLETIVNIFKAKPDEKINKIVDCFEVFDCPILTTNADKGIDGLLVKTGYKVFDHFCDEATLLSSKTITHIHGSVDERDKMVFTSKQYLDNYHKDGQICKNLQKVFSSDRIFLFLGYGAKEFEFLRQVLEQYGSECKIKYYILKEYRSNEQFLFNVEQKYFKDFGFEIIPYSLDGIEYDAFIETIDNWKNLIEEYSIIERNKINADILNDKPNKENVNYIIKQLKIPNSDKSIFHILKKSNYLKEWMEMLYEQNI